MKIGIIGAMDVEVAPILEKMRDARTDVRARLGFTEGTLGGASIVVARAGVGKVNAGICGYVLTCEYGCDTVVFTGVAGSVAPEVRVGDVVISTDCVYDDVDATNLGYAPGEVPQLGTAHFDADPALRSAAVDAARKAAAEVSPGTHVHEGTVASGDSFVCTVEDASRSHEVYGALCHEMEGAAVAQACWLTQVPFVVIRAISDSAYGFDLDEYNAGELAAAELAGAVTVRLVASLVHSG
ncbi:MAG: 5'-methylthioadenosine/adenosylhomocysteine nucleosidase [Olegusella sp.]|nr:5'-methylthioadenosine/adenosylhomocysteine nucleosidase [Olegusella sp.]